MGELFDLDTTCFAFPASLERCCIERTDSALSINRLEIEGTHPRMRRRFGQPRNSFCGGFSLFLHRHLLRPQHHHQLAPFHLRILLDDAVRFEVSPHPLDQATEMTPLKFETLRLQMVSLNSI